MTAVISEAPPAAAKRSSITATGLVLISIWGLIFVGIVWALVNSVDPERLASYGGRIAQGFVVTVELVIASMLIGALISIPVAAGRLSTNRLVAGIAFGFSYFFRGTPLVAQTFLVYYGAGQFSSELKAVGMWWLFRDALNCAVIAFALNTAAYQAEILSGAIRNVPRGQREGAAALGLHKWLTLRKIILPQALVSAIRPYGNEVILMTKASSIASIITVLDLMGQTRYVFSKTYDLSFYFWAALFYLATVEVVSHLVNLVEARLTRHVRPPSTARG
ncbi:MAG: ABC transporter permease [Rhizobiales bacterium]|nr:ABC transporter permease [Hyphomicrobiales bacterium]